MENDKPISGKTEDKLHRITFVNALASEIQRIKDKNSTVIGLYGKWGAGKTSILELLNEELKNRYYFTAYFNPWRFRSEDILLQELFLKILEGARSDIKLESKIQELGGFLQDYSQYISLPKISFFGAEVDATDSAKGVSKGVGRVLKGTDSFDSKKDKINKVLRDLALPLVIFIDDVDRLDVKEIQALFKLIKLTADFDNLIYVIAFDEEIVSKALAKNYGDGNINDGRSFLEKIVQLPLRIPRLTEQENFDYTVNLLNEWLKENNISLPDKFKGDFVRHFKSLHAHLIRTPRDSKRLLNSVSFSYQCLRDEVCIFDIILLETLRVFAPLIFDEIISHKFHLFSAASGQSTYTLRNEINDIGKAFKERISAYANVLPAIEEVVDFMFPANAIFNVLWNSYRSESREELFQYQRVGVEKYFDRYIEFKIGKQDISDSEFKGILKEINIKDLSLIGTSIERLSNFPKNAILTLLLAFKDQLTDLGKMNVAQMLNTKGHFFKSHNYMERMLPHRVTKFSLELIEKLDDEDKIATFGSILENCERINHASFFILESLRGYGREKEFKLQPENEVIRGVKDFLTGLQSKSIEVLFEDVDNEKNHIVFHLIETYGSVDKLKSDLLAFVNSSAANSLLIMKSLIHMVHINFSDVGVYDDEIRHAVFRDIEKYVPRDVLTQAAYKLHPDLVEDIPAGEIREMNTSTDKKIIIQYLRFVAGKIDPNDVN